MLQSDIDEIDFVQQHFIQHKIYSWDEYFNRLKYTCKYAPERILDIKRYIIEKKLVGEL